MSPARVLEGIYRSIAFTTPFIFPSRKSNPNSHTVTLSRTDHPSIVEAFSDHQADRWSQAVGEAAGRHNSVDVCLALSTTFIYLSVRQYTVVSDSVRGRRHTHTQRKNLGRKAKGRQGTEGIYDVIS